METVNRQVHSFCDILNMLGGLWLALLFYRKSPVCCVSVSEEVRIVSAHRGCEEMRAHYEIQHP